MQFKWLVLVSAVILTGCFDSQAGPTETELKNVLERKFPAGVKLTDLDIVAAENVGTKVDPVFKSRLKGELELAEDFYKRGKYLLGKDVLTKTASKGMKLELYGLAVSKLKSNKWNIQFTELGSKPNVDGYPLSNYRKGSYIFKGSSEEMKLIAEEKVEAERARKEMTAFRERMTGTWSAKKPILKNNKAYTHIGHEDDLMYSVTFPAGNDFKGTAKVTYYGTNPKRRPVTIDALYVVETPYQVSVKDMQMRAVGNWSTSNTWEFISATLPGGNKVLNGSNRDDDRDRYTMSLYKQ